MQTRSVEMKKIILLFVLGIALTACQSQPQATEAANPDQSGEEAEQAIVEEEVILPALQEATPTDPIQMPTQTFEGMMSDIPEEVVTQYVAFVSMDMTARLLESIATSLQEDDIDSTEGAIQLLATAIIYDDVVNALDASPIAPITEGIWEDAQSISQDIQNMIAQWFNDEIDSSVVLGLLPSLNAEIQDLLSTVESLFSDEYGINPAELSAFRNSELDRMMEELSSSTLGESGDEEPADQTDIEISNLNWYVDSIDVLHFIGTVTNHGETNLDYVKIIVNLRDGDGTLIATDYSYTSVDLVLLDQTVPFSVTFFDDPGEWADYEIMVEADTARDEGFQGLEIISSTGSPGTYSMYEIIGEVRNTSASDAEFVKIVAMLFDADENLIAVDYCYSSLDTVPAGGTSPFSLVISGGVDEEVASYELIVEGSEAWD